MGFNDFLAKLFGNKSQRDLKEITPYVEQVKKAYEEVKILSNDELRQLTRTLRQQISEYVSAERQQIQKLKEGIEEKELSERETIWAEVDRLEVLIMDRMEEKLTEILPQAFSIVKETARRFADSPEITVTACDFDRELAIKHDFLRIEGDKAIYANHWMAGGNEITWDMVHYDVQLFGGVVLHQGKIAEMATGEGKTLVATLPVFLNALTGNGVHVVTVNDYLSKRDSEWMGPLYMFHGLSVDCIDKYEPNSEERKRAYNCDITFGTNNEFGFDYLRDNMARTLGDLVQRKHNYAIVDEVDSVLIDDARTPLIISGPVETAGDQLFEEYRTNVEVVVDAQRKLATQLLTEAKQKMRSEDKKEQEEGVLLLYRSFKGLPKNKALIKFLSEEGVKAKMLKAEEYYMQDNMRNMHLVTDDLFFVIDEKNSQIELTDKGLDLLTGKMEDPKFFVLPDITTQMAELDNVDFESEEARAAKKDELLANYSIKSERVHTIHQLLKAYTLFEKDDKYVVMDNKVLIVDEQTGRIMDGRRYSDGLHQAIEAKERVKVEAASQTKATITLQNYFRMYHKLAGMTGTAETEAKEFWDIYKLDVVVIPTNKPIARKDENDRIYKTARAKYAAVIEEIEDLISQGRPVLVGTTSVEISELLSRMLTMKKIPHNVLNAKLHQKEAEIVALAGQRGTVTIATNMAGRGTDIKLSPEVKAAGGLAIIGTERHESRRVDRQLRGRAGRQGDPGSSVFFVSLEDRLMRLFGSERIAGMLDRLGFKEEDRLEGNQMTRSVERAQKKVEENNFGVRKHLLEYDDVKNAQRKVIYTRRNHALIGERIGLDVVNTLNQCADIILEEYNGGSYEELQNEVLKTFAIELPFSADEHVSLSLSQKKERLMKSVIETLKRRMDRIVSIADPVLQRVYEQQGQIVQQIYVPIADGKLMYNIPVNLKEAVTVHSKNIPAAFQKTIMLYTIDEAWEEHLRDMDELQNAVRNVSYENKDPLVIFKMEAYELFRAMVERMSKKAASIIMRGNIPIAEETSEQASNVNVQEKVDDPRLKRRNRNTEHKDEYQEAQEARHQAGLNASRSTEEKSQPYTAGERIGRNDPCPCGSGKKFKNCHGRDL